MDLDTEAGWVRFSLQAAEQVDFKKVADVFESASYKLRTIEVELSGEVVEEAGDRWLVVDRTGQRILLDTDSVSSTTSRVRGVVHGWETASPKLSLTPAPGS